MTKQAEIIGDIQKKIASGAYTPGRPLPTQKALSSQYGVAVGTVRHALGSLVNQGLLKSRRGSGTIVSPDVKVTGPAPSAGRRQLGLLVPDSRAALFVRSYVLAIQRLLLQDPNLEISLRFTQNQTKESILQWAKPLCGILAQDTVSLDLLNHLRATGKPVMVMGHLLSGGCPSWAGQVCIDVDQHVRMCVQFAYSLAHRRCLLIRESGSYYMDSVGRAFHREAQKIGADLQHDELIVDRSDHGDELLMYLAAAECPPSIVIVEGGFQACRNLYALERNGWRVPEQISVLAINGVPEPWLCTPDLSRVEMPTEQWAIRLVEAMYEMLDKGTIIRAEVAPSLVWGKTCERFHGDQPNAASKAESNGVSPRSN
ncbi:substrate-binding domain-containing protein [Phycisphaerales bacterium AB-hyl4]|uniref:Substrate-binding domain-containing protein n=1 Tax=Natronomicrosphaera hydrolytica TaxID=3242702 RepID=A0ABV4UC43_9BACT